jgi:hypothetical protein
MVELENLFGMSNPWISTSLDFYLLGMLMKSRSSGKSFEIVKLTTDLSNGLCARSQAIEVYSATNKINNC